MPVSPNLSEFQFQSQGEGGVAYFSPSKGRRIFVNVSFIKLSVIVIFCITHLSEGGVTFLLLSVSDGVWPFGRTSFPVPQARGYGHYLWKVLASFEIFYN